VVALWAAFRMYRIIRSPKDLLDLQLDGIRFGDVLYDAVLALGYATIDRIDGRTFQVLWRFYFLRSFIGYVIRRYPVRRAVFAHLIGLQGSTFSRYLLQQGIEVVNRVGSHEILLKKYRSLRDVGVFPVKPEPKYFNLMLRQDDGTILRLAEEYMERRFSKQVDQLSVDLAFDPRKRTFKTRQDFCTAYGLDDSRPVVFVLLHTFNDYPHSHFARPMIFQDYYHWFQRTLEIAREIRSVNWVFKEHPAAAYYITRDLELRSAFSGIREKNVLFLPSDADFNGRSVGNLAHAILTCIGTSGLEYATLGIPCVLGGDSQYSGLGFTLEPRDAGEYTEILHGIDRLERLQPEQIKAAKVTAYFYFCIMESARFHFCPHFSIKEISEWDAERSERLWQAAASGLRDESHRERLRRQIEELGDFVTDAARTQYVNLQQFPFLQGPESGQRLGGQAKSGSAFQRAVGTNRVYF
jgi:predicted RNA binding protein YcfA (HicA-like mRNA interferase family)